MALSSTAAPCNRHSRPLMPAPADPVRLPPFAAPSGDGIDLCVRLSPAASRNSFTGCETVRAPHGKDRIALRASVTAAPENGKANAALIALLAKALHVPKSALTVTRGQTDRTKTLHLAAAPTPELAAALQALAP